MNTPTERSWGPESWVLVELNEGDRRRRGHLILFLPVLIISLTIFSILNIRLNEFVNGGLQLLLAILLLISMIGLRYVRNAYPLFRMNIAFLSMLGIYSTWAGTHDGAAVLTLYVYPVILFYFLGKVEGSIWLALVLVPSLLILFLPDSVNAFVYPEPYRIRIAATLLVVALFSYLTESLRQKAYHELTIEKDNLTVALAEISTLRGIIPICSYCKQIRNDDGLWSQIELYIRQHSDADFSHGICPDCARKHFPDMDMDLDLGS